MFFFWEWEIVPGQEQPGFGGPLLHASPPGVQRGRIDSLIPLPEAGWLGPGNCRRLGGAEPCLPPAPLRPPRLLPAPRWFVPASVADTLSQAGIARGGRSLEHSGALQIPNRKRLSPEPAFLGMDPPTVLVNPDALSDPCSGDWCIGGGASGLSRKVLPLASSVTLTLITPVFLSRPHFAHLLAGGVHTCLAGL